MYSEVKLQSIAIFAIALWLAAPAFPAAPKVIAVDITGVVHPVTTEIVGSAIQRARALAVFGSSREM